MVPTNTDALATLFRAAILAIEPRLQYQGAARWIAYDRKEGAANRTRRFRLAWEAGGRQPGGCMAGPDHEYFAFLRVQTDYAGEHAKQQHILIEDFYQLEESLTATKATDNGVVLVEGLRIEGDPDGKDVVQIDHVFRVRYMRRIRL